MKNCIVGMLLKCPIGVDFSFKLMCLLCIAASTVVFRARRCNAVTYDSKRCSAMTGHQIARLLSRVVFS